MLVLQNRGSGDIPGSAGTRAAVRNRLRELQRHGGDAQPLLNALGDKGLSVNGAQQMHVQVGTFRHGLEKSVELTRPHLLCCGKRMRRTRLAGRERRCCGLGMRTTESCNDEET